MKITIKQALEWATDKLAQNNVSSPSLEADIFLSFLLTKNREYLLSHPEESISGVFFNKLKKIIEKRSTGQPAAQIIGQKEFFGFNFLINKNVLIPRPETELLVEEALKLLSKIPDKKNNLSWKEKKITCIDIGTGSGCIIISLVKKLKNHKRTEFFGLDISNKALRVARQNAKAHELGEKILFKKSNLLEALIKEPELLIVDHPIIITANLPYLPSSWKNKLNSPETIGLGYEPVIALEGGSDGLDLYRKLAQQIEWLIKQGKEYQPNRKIAIFCEISASQSEKIGKLFSFMEKIEIKKDLSGFDRLLIATNNIKV
jgi:release factor glutamine methyltransferase